LIISQKIIKEANKPSGMVTSGSITAVSKPGNIVLNKGLQQLLNSSPGGTLATQNKVVYLNRSTIKPMGNVAPGTHRVPIRIVSTPNTGGAVTTTASSSPIMVDPATGSKVAKTVNVQTIKPTGSVLAQGTIRQAGNVGTKSYLLRKSLRRQISPRAWLPVAALLPSASRGILCLTKAFSNC